MGLGLPVEFVYDPASVGGAGMRFIVAKAQRRFEQRQRLLIDRFCNRAWRYFIGGAIANGDLPAVEDYAKVTWQTPKSLTVDAGREAQQSREDYKAGLTTLSDYFGELGMDWMEVSDQRKIEQAYLGGGEAQPEPLITKIGVGGAQSLTALLQSIGQGLVSPEQAVVILVSIFGMNQDDAERIAKGAPTKSATATGGESAPAPQEPVAEAPAIDEPTPINPEKDPNAGPDAELSAKVELDLPTQEAGETDDKFMNRCMGNPTMVSEFPENDQRAAVCARQMKLSAKPQTESFTMKDDPDFNLSSKELDMVAKAVGLKDKKPRTARKK
jgi:hypothetical protein